MIHTIHTISLQSSMIHTFYTQYNTCDTSNYVFNLSVSQNKTKKQKCI